MSQPHMFFVIYPILVLTVIAIDLYILGQVLNMQKDSYSCKCAQKWYLKHVSTALIIILSIQAALFLFGVVARVFHTSNVITGASGVLSISLFFVQIYYIIMMLTMLKSLKQDNCLCVDPGFISLMKYYSGIRAVFAFIVIIAIIILSVTRITSNL